MKLFLTKKALTVGIVYAECEVEHYENGAEIVFHKGRIHSREGFDWHKTYDSALARAVDMRERQIKIHERRLAVLRDMTFTDPTI